MSKPFHTTPRRVLKDAAKFATVAAVVTVDANGRLSVAGSDSTPVTLALLRQGIREVARLTK